MLLMNDASANRMHLFDFLVCVMRRVNSLIYSPGNYVLLRVNLIL